MNKKQLIDLGVPEDIAEQVVVMHGRDIEGLKGTNETLSAEVETLRTQYQSANEQIEAFKGMDIDGVKATATEWEQKAKQAQEELEERVYQMTFERSLEDVLTGVGAKNLKSVEALLDYEKLDMTEDGNITGLEDQLAQVMVDNPFLFEEDEDEPRIVGGAQHGGTVLLSDPAVAAARKAAGLKDKK